MMLVKICKQNWVPDTQLTHGGGDDDDDDDDLIIWKKLIALFWKQKKSL